MPRRSPVCSTKSPRILHVTCKSRPAGKRTNVIDGGIGPSAINDEETLKRFKHFVNSPEPDSNIQFVDERGQIKPRNALQQIPVVTETAA